jgi:hypothetical protein
MSKYSISRAIEFDEIPKYSSNLALRKDRSRLTRSAILCMSQTFLPSLLPLSSSTLSLCGIRVVSPCFQQNSDGDSKKGDLRRFSLSLSDVYLSSLPCCICRWTVSTNDVTIPLTCASVNTCELTIAF